MYARRALDLSYAPSRTGHLQRAAFVIRDHVGLRGRSKNIFLRIIARDCFRQDGNLSSLPSLIVICGITERWLARRELEFYLTAQIVRITHGDAPHCGTAGRYTVLREFRLREMLRRRGLRSRKLRVAARNRSSPFVRPARGVKRYSIAPRRFARRCRTTLPLSPYESANAISCYASAPCCRDVSRGRRTTRRCSILEGSRDRHGDPDLSRSSLARHDGRPRHMDVGRCSRTLFSSLPSSLSFFLSRNCSLDKRERAGTDGL